MAYLFCLAVGISEYDVEILLVVIFGQGILDEADLMTNCGGFGHA